LTTLLSEGDEIRGDKIFFCFGKVVGPTTKGARRIGLLKRNGQAWVMRPLKKARAPIGREMDSINCESAAYECDEFEDKGKQAYGAHRGLTGNLIGDAVCTIKHPLSRLSKS
jgi:hypothetical protein